MAKSFRMESEWTQDLNGSYTIRRYLWNTSNFTWGEPTVGRKGFFDKYGRKTSTKSGSKSSGGSER